MAARRERARSSGDVALVAGLAAQHPFATVEPWIQGVSQAGVNIETVDSESGVGVAAEKSFVFRSPPDSIAVLLGAGFDGASLANNHALDYGVVGLTRTMALADEGGLLRAGAGSDTLSPTPMHIARSERWWAVIAWRCSASTA